MKKEIELKYRFASKSDFENFYRLLLKQTKVEVVVLAQENYFFDTDEKDLYQKHAIVRGRIQGEDYFLCIKAKLQDRLEDKNLFVRLELEQKIEKKTFSLLNNQHLMMSDVVALLNIDNAEEKRTKEIIRVISKDFSNKPLKLIGKFSTSRSILAYSIQGQDLEFEFDHVKYSDGSEVFEIEIELKDAINTGAIESAITKLLRQAQVETISPEAKSDRIFDDSAISRLQDKSADKLEG